MKVYKTYIAAKAHTRGNGLIVRIGGLYLANVNPATPIVVWDRHGIPKGSTTILDLTTPAASGA